VLTTPLLPEDAFMKSAREKVDIVAAFHDVGTYRGAAAVCGVDPKSVNSAGALFAISPFGRMSSSEAVFVDRCRPQLSPIFRPLWHVCGTPRGSGSLLMWLGGG
jgi:hypothetical protein